MSALAPKDAKPNALELAILERLPLAGIPIHIDHLNVVGREITGAGSYTTFSTPSDHLSEGRRHVGLDALIEVPGVPNGLGAVLWICGEVAECLEIYTYDDDDAWDGSFAGYAIV